jgi:hypothetical protein
MTFKVAKTKVASASEIANQLVGSYYYDCYCFANKQQARNALQIWIDHMAKTPSWVNAMMNTRNKIAAMIGLKNLGELNGLDFDKQTNEYTVGDKVGIFTLLYLTESEIILGDCDKHLNVKVSVFKAADDSRLVSISTVVHVHNFLGKLYMLFVTPMHKLIVPASIKRAETYNAS